MVYFFVDEEEKCMEKQLYYVVNGKVSQNAGKKSFFLTHEKKFETFFFFGYKIKYFLSSTIDTTLSQ